MVLAYWKRYCPDALAALEALLRLSPRESGPPGPAQVGGLGSATGPISIASEPGTKVAFFADLFAAREVGVLDEWVEVPPAQDRDRQQDPDADRSR